MMLAPNAISITQMLFYQIKKNWIDFIATKQRLNVSTLQN